MATDRSDPFRTPDGPRGTDEASALLADDEADGTDAVDEPTEEERADPLGAFQARLRD